MDSSAFHGTVCPLLWMCVHPNQPPSTAILKSTSSSELFFKHRNWCHRCWLPQHLLLFLFQAPFHPMGMKSAKCRKCSRTQKWQISSCNNSSNFQIICILLQGYSAVFSTRPSDIQTKLGWLREYSSIWELSQLLIFIIGTKQAF